MGSAGLDQYLEYPADAQRRPEMCIRDSRGADDHRHYLPYRVYAAGDYPVVTGLRAERGVQQTAA